MWQEEPIWELDPRVFALPWGTRLSSEYRNVHLVFTKAHHVFKYPAKKYK
jgi:hypothetical protein